MQSIGSSILNFVESVIYAPIAFSKKVVELFAIDDRKIEQITKKANECLETEDLMETGNKYLQAKVFKLTITKAKLKKNDKEFKEYVSGLNFIKRFFNSKIIKSTQEKVSELKQKLKTKITECENKIPVPAVPSDDVSTVSPSSKKRLSPLSDSAKPHHSRLSKNLSKIRGKHDTLGKKMSASKYEALFQETVKEISVQLLQKMEFLHKKITPEDIHSYKGKESETNNFAKAVEFHSKIASVVISTILTSHHLRDSQNIFHFWEKVAAESRQAGNYDGFCAIMEGLSNTSTSRLFQEKLFPKNNKIFKTFKASLNELKTFEEVCSPLSSFKKLKDEIASRSDNVHTQNLVYFSKNFESLRGNAEVAKDSAPREKLKEQAREYQKSIVSKLPDTVEDTDYFDVLLKNPTFDFFKRSYEILPKPAKK